MVVDDPVYYTYLNRYKISSVLKDLGKPSEIYLTILRVSGEGVSHDQKLILFYPDKGALLSYKGMYTKVGGKYQFCLNKAFVTLKLFLPHQYLIFKEPLLIGVSKTNEEMMNRYYDSFLPLEDSTNLDIDSFYTHYKQDNGDCLETPIDLWK